MVLMRRVCLKASWHFYLWCPLPFPVVLCVWLKQKHCYNQVVTVSTYIVNFLCLTGQSFSPDLAFNSQPLLKEVKTYIETLPLSSDWGIWRDMFNSETHPIYLAENIACEVLSTFQVKLTFVSFKHEYYVNHIVIFLRHNACWNIIPQQRE